jgi:D-3-phosphoglycerate dehydrogenase
MHVPNLPETKDMMGKKQFALMKKGSIFLNLARGNILDVNALCEALENGHLIGAGVDAYKLEPKSKDDELITEFRKFYNMILTPHIGGLTEEAQVNMALDMAEKMANFLQNGNTNGATNFPEINVAPNKNQNTTRILHIHKNLAGLMMEINKIFGKEHINITAQYLQTKGELGYAIIDIESKTLRPEVIEKLKKINNTIKVIII